MAHVDDKGNGRTINTRGLGFYEPDAETHLVSQSEGPIYHSCYSTSEYNIEEALNEEPILVGAKKAPQEPDEGVQSTVDDLTERNLGPDKDPRPTTISASLTKEEKAQLKSLLLDRGLFCMDFQRNARARPESGSAQTKN